MEQTELSEGPGHSFDFSKFKKFCIPDRQARTFHDRLSKSLRLAARTKKMLLEVGVTFDCRQQSAGTFSGCVATGAGAPSGV